MSLEIDKTVKLEIDGSSQRVRMCAARAGLPPLLIVQGGPGLPLLHEVAKFQRLLHLEDEFLVVYWEQRGCGNASQRDARGVSMQQQVDDLRTVLKWLHHETQQTVTVFGISLGATFVLQAVAHEPESARAVIAMSADADNAASDASVQAFLLEKSTLPNGEKLSAKLNKLGTPPYLAPAPFQLRARLLADHGTIERGKKFGAMLREMLFGMIGTYGPVGAARALRNMNLILGALLPEVASLDLFANPPRAAIPVHYAFGALDPLMPASIVTRLPDAIAAPKVRLRS
jgi:pimeloyl-ACP methyl ester carboxylesterase